MPKDTGLPGCPELVSSSLPRALEPRFAPEGGAHGG